MAYRVVRPDELDWETRPADPGEPRRHTSVLSELVGYEHARANIWRYEPGAKGGRHRHPQQEETFVVVHGTLTMYLGEPPVDPHGLAVGAYLDRSVWPFTVT